MNINEMMSRAMFYYKNEDFEKTLHFLDKIISEDPANSEVKEFLNKVKKRLSLEPYINHFLEYSTKLYNEGRFKEAIEQAEKAITTDPESNKAKAFLEKIKSEANHTSGIEPFPEEALSAAEVRTDKDSPFIFDADEFETESADSESVVEQESVFDKPFGFDKPPAEQASSVFQEPANSETGVTAQKDDFVFTIETDDIKTEAKEKESQADLSAKNKESTEQDVISEPKEAPIFDFETPPPSESAFDDNNKNTSDEADHSEGKSHLSPGDFEFEAPEKQPLDKDSIISEAEASEGKLKEPGKKELNLFDFEAEPGTGGQESKSDIEFEEAEVGFFSQKETSAESTGHSSMPLSKSKTQTSESLLNDFQNGLILYKELNLKEALDIFTRILSHEKEFIDELPDLFEESRQLFLEIKSKLKDNSQVDDIEEMEGEPEGFDDLIVKPQISIKKHSQISNVKLYTAVSVGILFIIFAGILFIRFTGKTAVDIEEEQLDSPAEFSQEFQQQQKSERLEKLYAEANKLIREGKDEQAEEIIAQMLELDPDNTKAIEAQNRINLTKYLARGEKAYEIHNYKEAFENFDKAFSINPDIQNLREKLDHSRNAYHNNVNLYERMNNYLQFKEKGDIDNAYRILNAIKIDHPESKFVLIEFEIISKIKYAQDEKIRQEQIQSYMGNARYHFNNALYELAIAEYRKALALDPKNLEINEMLYKSFYNTGIEALQRRDCRTAYWAFNEALKLFPDDKDSQNLSDFAFKNLEKITSPNYSDYVSSLGKKN